MRKFKFRRAVEEEMNGSNLTCNYYDCYSNRYCRSDENYIDDKTIHFK